MQEPRSPSRKSRGHMALVEGSMPGWFHPEHSSSATHLPVPTCSRLATVCRNVRGGCNSASSRNTSNKHCTLEALSAATPASHPCCTEWRTWHDAVGSLLHQPLGGNSLSLKHHQMTNRRDSEFNWVLPVVQYTKDDQKGGHGQWQEPY